MKIEQKFDEIWKDGKMVEVAPPWAKYRQLMTSEFPSPFKTKDDPLANTIQKAVEKIEKLRPEKDGPAYLGTETKLQYSYPEVKNVAIAQKGESIDKVIDDVVNLFQGAPNWGNPLTMCNIIPQANSASIVASMISQIFSPNILEGEYSMNVHKAELETAGMIANLIGWKPTEAGSLYTWGGGGCWTYALKYALTRVLPESRDKGIKTDAKVLCSQQAHYVKQNATDWMGLGMNNLVQIKTNNLTNQMDTDHLEEVMKDLHKKGIPIAMVVSTMGTTDASVFDPIEKIREIMDRYPNGAEYGKTLLYADCVVGWSWMYFNFYDFEKNPLGFSEHILPILKCNADAYKGVFLADAIGVDFHKLGWSPYISSCFVYKNAAEFEGLLKRGKDAYLQVRTPYNPMYYTLEVSRTSSGSLAGWATLKYFGLEGMQAILGGILETKYYLYSLIEEAEDMVCVNADDTGFITLFRVYPEGVNAKEEFQKELIDPSKRNELVKYNRNIEAVGNKLYDWYRSGKKINGKYTPYMSFSTGFRPAEYNTDEKDGEAVIYALKSFPMNIFVTPEIMQHVVVCVREAQKEVQDQLGL